MLSGVLVVSGVEVVSAVMMKGWLAGDFPELVE